MQKKILKKEFFYPVGVQGIEPCLNAPKALVLPVYDTPNI